MNESSFYSPRKCAIDKVIINLFNDQIKISGESSIRFAEKKVMNSECMGLLMFSVAYLSLYKPPDKFLLEVENAFFGNRKFRVVYKDGRIFFRQKIFSV